MVQDRSAVTRKFRMLPQAVLEALFEQLGGTKEVADMAEAEQLSGGRLGMFTGQWADLPRKTLLKLMSAMGYGAVERACWGDHFDVDKAAGPDGEAYCEGVREEVEAEGLVVSALSDHLGSQALLDAPTPKLQGILPPEIWSDDGATLAANVQARLKKTGLAAKRLGVKVVNGFTGHSAWADIYDFPPGMVASTQAAYRLFGDRMTPVLDVFGELGIRYALEVHPTEIGYDINTFGAALDAVKRHPAFGVNHDPSHLIPQNIDPVDFILAFPDRIFNMHAKDSKVHDTGRQGIYGSHLTFGDQRRRWNFGSPGHGDVDFDGIARALIFTGFTGFIAVEWEDTLMNRWVGASEAVPYITQKMLFPKSSVRFDAAFAT